MSITMHVDDAPAPGLDAAGRPDPAYAARLGLRPAPSGRRAAAFTLDAAAYALAASPAVVGAVLLANAVVGSDAATGVDPSSLVLPLVLIAVGQLLVTAFGITQLAMHGRRGVTLGKRALGLRSVQVADFGRAGFWRVVLRVLVLWASQVVLPLVGPALMFASGLWDPEQRGRSWLDRVGRCWVLDVREGLDPFDLKALRHARRQLDAPAASVARMPSLATDRGVDEETFIPQARSASGVVAAVAEAGAWTPPPIAAPSASSAAVASPGAPAVAASAAVPASAAATAPTPSLAPAAVFAFDDGSRLDASGTGLLGRRPARAEGDPAGTLLVPLADDSMGISKTHARFDVDDAGIWITDRWSRNGTSVAAPGRAPVELVPGAPTRVDGGTKVELGGRWFVVEEVTAR
ncbi:MAG TPA: RDD family protein [Agromyces mariniharenae]|nr:RDD family protein [Agromyces mariniharenae]